MIIRVEVVIHQDRINVTFYQGNSFSFWAQSKVKLLHLLFFFKDKLVQ